MTLVNAETGEVVAACTPDEARALTERIRSTADALWALLLEAHERRAWAALGYGSFVDYAEAEFGMGHSHAYRLLDQGRVVREIEAAVAEAIPHSPDGEWGDPAPVDVDADPVPLVPTITEAEARDIKPHLAEVTDAIRDRLAEADDPEPAEITTIVREEVDRARTKPPLPVPRSAGTIAFDALMKLSKGARAFLEEATPERMGDLADDEWESFQRLAELLDRCTQRIADGGRQRRQLRSIQGGRP